MEIPFAFLIKLLTIFIGCGLFTLFAFWIAKQISTIPGLIIASSNKFKNSEKIKISKDTKISSQSGLYEVLFPNKSRLKLFSSDKGIKIIN